jgi:hypothetical protein
VYIIYIDIKLYIILCSPNPLYTKNDFKSSYYIMYIMLRKTISSAQDNSSETMIQETAPAPTHVSEQDDAALKNINYKNMLLTGNYGMIKPDIITNPNIDDILENEKNTNKSEPWNKLDKSAKMGKLKEFAMRHGTKENYTEQEITTLYQFLFSALDQKKLMRAKDVIYDKVSGVITSIPCLVYNAGFKKFTLKRCEKRQSTLKSLAPPMTSMSKKRKLVIDETKSTD